MNRRTFLQGALAVAVAGLLRPRRHPLLHASSQTQGHPNILLLVFDTFSAYHTSLYGYARDTTPNLARFADRATVYHRHYTTGNFTTPATASLLTGVYPWSHRALHINGTVLTPFAAQNLFSALSDTGYDRVAYTHNSLVNLLLGQMAEHLEHFVPTRDLTLFDEILADRLFPHDFEVAFLGERLILPKDERVLSSSLFLSLWDCMRREQRVEATRLQYAESFPRGTPRADRHARYFLLEDAINWLMRYTAAAADPYLLYAHVYPPHAPYNTRQEFINTFANDRFTPVPKENSLFGSERPEILAQNRKQYDEYILYTDAELGRLLTQLEEQGTLDDTVVIITSDHGEMFERGISGHITPVLYEPLLRVPLLVHLPGQTERQDVFTPTSIIDLLPTIASLSQQPLPVWGDGQVLPGLNGAGSGRGRGLYALEAKSNRKTGPLTKATIALIKDDHKLVHYFGYDDNEPWYELYDVVHDPEELINLYDQNDPLSQTLLQELESTLMTINQA